MRYANAKEFLDAMLGGEVLDDQALTSIRTELKEGQYLELKRGDILADGKKATKLLREYVSGFANADGGVLVIGVDEKTAEIVPCTHPGRGSLSEWIFSVLQPLAGFLTPYPQVQVLDTGPVVAIAVARAPQYVPAAEGGILAYYLRFGDKTLRMPDFLLADVFLGRRQQPALTLQVRPTIDRVAAQQGRSSSFAFSIWNEGLVTAEEVEAGMVCWSRADSEQPITHHLRSHLDVSQPAGAGWYLRHLPGKYSRPELLRIPPFGRNVWPIEVAGFRFPLECKVRISVGIYILAKQATPTWFEYRFMLWIPAIDWQDPVLEDIHLERLVSRRPRISVEEV